MESSGGLHGGRETRMPKQGMCSTRLPGGAGPHTLDELVGELSPRRDKPGHDEY
jgi:hypothetical protein